MNEEGNKNELNEPPAEYKQKWIQFYSSFEEADKAGRLEQLKLSPEQRLANACLLIKTIYKKELSQNKGLGTRIYFDTQ